MMQDEFNEEYEDVVDHSVFICTEETDQYSSSKVFNLNSGDRPVLQLKGVLSVEGTGQILSSYAVFFICKFEEVPVLQLQGIYFVRIVTDKLVIVFSSSSHWYPLVKGFRNSCKTWQHPDLQSFIYIFTFSTLFRCTRFRSESSVKLIEAGCGTTWASYMAKLGTGILITLYYRILLVDYKSLKIKNKK